MRTARSAAKALLAGLVVGAATTALTGENNARVVDIDISGALKLGAMTTNEARIDIDARSAAADTLRAIERRSGRRERARHIAPVTLTRAASAR